jgi:hypothetical protein
MQRFGRRLRVRVKNARLGESHGIGYPVGKLTTTGQRDSRGAGGQLREQRAMSRLDVRRRVSHLRRCEFSEAKLPRAYALGSVCPARYTTSGILAMLITGVAFGEHGFHYASLPWAWNYAG